ncbi:SLATT domain-containing protein [Photorhabdus heterorhabditis]|uniref:SLATT domain-containing protein n=1 Tax=Photorhabdus heterorhabditis TaxID=880156 RepID=UPI001BD23CB1|nr:SLATT domain-containing protein [Photorhabdus heterorhabditis]
MKDKIWFTYKARIQAYHRLERWDVHSQFLLIWYAILGVGLSVVAIRFPKILGNNTDIISAILSIALLVLSLTVSNRDFRGRALNMQKNYLTLQNLYNAIPTNQDPTQDQIARYNDLLSDIENHKEIDDKTFRVFNRQYLSSRKPHENEIFQVYLRMVTRKVAILILYLLPFLGLVLL